MLQESGTAVLNTPSIASSLANLSFGVTLPKPRDEASFTVDVKNSGTIEAVLSSISLNGADTAKAESVTYTATYSDGSELSVYDTN